MVRQEEISSPRKAEEIFDQIEKEFSEKHSAIPKRQREKLLKTFRQDRERKVLESIVKTKEKVHKLEADKNIKRIGTLQNEVEQTKTMLENERNRLNLRIRELEDNVMTLKSQDLANQNNINNLKEKLEYEKQKNGDRETYMKEEVEKKMKSLEEDKKSLQKELDRRETEALKGNSEVEKYKMLLEQQKQLNQEACQKLNKKISKQEKIIEDYSKKEEEYSAAVKKLQKSDEIKEMREQLESIKTKKRKLENENGEIKIEKQYLENQLKFYKEQIDDNKKLQDTLLGALQQQIRVDDDNTATELLSTNKNLGTSLGKAESRIKHLENKINRYKLYKKMVNGAKAFQCKETGKLINKNAFLSHLQNMANRTQKSDGKDSRSSSPKNDGEPIVKINQTLIKECPNTGRAFTEYLMHVRHGRGFWKITRTYREFWEFNHQLINEFPNIQLPSASSQILGFGGNVSSLISNKKRTVLEDRRIALQEYLNDLFKINQIAKSTILKQFLKIDIYVDEVGIVKNDSYMKSPIKKENSSYDIASAYKNASYMELESGVKQQYSSIVTESRKGRVLKENSLINNYN